MRIRIALFMLLFANLAFLAWSQWVDTPARARSADATASLPRLKLASESPAPMAVADPQASAASCLSVGPFDDASSASRGVEMLKNRGFRSSQHSEPRTASQGFWVHVGGLANDSVASADLQKLSTGGLTDARVLQSGKDERRISVGLFMARDQANQRLQEVRRLGLKAEITERRLPATLYWIDVAISPEDGTLPAQDLYKGPSAQMGARPCPPGTPLPGEDQTTDARRAAVPGPATATPAVKFL